MSTAGMRSLCYASKIHLHCINVVVIIMQNEDACPYLEVVDPEYPQRARDVIDELAAEVAELRENATIARHEFHIMQEDDRVVDREVRDIEEVEAVVLLGCCR